MTKLDTSRLHLDAMIAQGYRTKKTLVWGTPVSATTREIENRDAKYGSYRAVSWVVFATNAIEYATASGPRLSACAPPRPLRCTDLTTLDEMILLGFRGGKGSDLCRLSAGTSRATRAHERREAQDHVGACCWIETNLIRINYAPAKGLLDPTDPSAVY